MAVDPAVPPSFYAALGFMVVGGFALRPDRVERLAATARRLARQGPFAASPELAAIAGVELAAMRGVLTGLGYRAVRENGGEIFMACPRRRRKTGKRAPRRPPAEGHPFAKLQELRLT
jgi:ATP-dependent RNA helicase SUPV3L1/SUV3